jgi:hypothetical protein
MSNAVVEVLVGLVFVFFLFSLLCTGVNESFARVADKRGEFLALGIWQLLGDGGGSDPDWYFREFWIHPLVTQLSQQYPTEGSDLFGRVTTMAKRLLTSRHGKAARAAIEGRYTPPRHPPSYIPASTFVAVVGTLTHAKPVPPTSKLGQSLRALEIEASDDPELERAHLTLWYDGEMGRVSGWYKREAKRVLIAIATVVVLALNIDTIAIARTLWSDPTTRNALADVAASQVQGNAATTTVPGASGAAPLVVAVTCKKPAPKPSGGGVPATTTTTARPSGGPGQVVTELRCQPLPLGWRLSSSCARRAAPDAPCAGVPSHVEDVAVRLWRAGIVGAALKLLGLAITIGALTFGAPFWFDLLNRFGSVRDAGTKPPATTA